MLKNMISRIITVIMLLVMCVSLPFTAAEVYGNELSAFSSEEQSLGQDESLSAQGYKIIVRYRITVKRKTKKKSKKIKMDPKKLSVYQGDYDWICLDKANNKKVKWRSSNKKIVSIKKDGEYCRITGKKKGKAVITAKYKGKTYKCKVTVKEKAKNVFALDKIKNGGTVNINDAGDCLFSLDTSVNNIDVYCENSDESVIMCQWDECGRLVIHPLRTGESWVTLSNSYNSETIRFKVVVSESNYWFEYVEDSEEGRNYSIKDGSTVYVDYLGSEVSILTDANDCTNVKMKAEAEDSSKLKIDWCGNWFGDDSTSFYIYPKNYYSNGETWVTFSNSVNSQQLRLKVVIIKY